MTATVEAQQASTNALPPPEMPLPAADVIAAAPAGNFPTDQRTLLFKNKFRILPLSPLSDFKTVGADAFEAEEIGDSSRKCVAMVCRPGFPLRFDAIQLLSGVNLPGIMSIIETGTIDWPDTNDRRLVIVLQRPTGKRCIGLNQPSFPKMTEADIMRLVAQPLTYAIRSASERKVTLRNINPYNMFWEDSSNQRILLQDGFTTPPGYGQPACVETIDSAMCDRDMRGEGSIADDIFALGVTMLMLATGRAPLANSTPDQQLHLRMDVGSFEALVGLHAIPVGIMEALRGTLIDDPEEQWDLEDLEAWVRGSRQSVKSARPPRHASRHMEFLDKQYTMATTLSYAFALNWAKAAELIRAKTLDPWLRRAMSNEIMADELTKLTGAKNGPARHTPDDVLVARTIAIINPGSPICYRRLIGKIDGIGYAIALAYAQQDTEKLNLLMQLLTQRLPLHWLNALPDNKKKAFNDIMGKFELLPGIIDARGPGFGIERAIYMLIPKMPCLSSSFQNDYVQTPNDVLPALDKLASSPLRPTSPIDRHIAAYLGSRVAEVKDADLRPLGPPAEPFVQTMAALYLLAKIQRVYKLRDLPHLSNWCMDLLRPTLSRFKNIARRQKITDMVNARAKTGQLYELVRSADNEEETQQDEIGFERAAMEHAAITLRIANLEEMRRSQSQIATLRGERVAVVLAALLALTYFLCFFYLHFKEQMHG